jgi:hypothetical protein
MKKYLSIIIGLLLLGVLFISITSVTRADTTAAWGSISGTTYYRSGWSVYPLPFTLVKAGSRYTISGLFAHYSINLLPLGRYTVTASHNGYAPSSVVVTLTSGNPNQVVNFILNPN